MENFNLKNIIPIGLIFPFILLIGLEYFLIFGLDYYNQRLSQQISNLETTLTQKETELGQGLKTNEAFYVFSQIGNIVEILKNRKSVNLVINKFNRIMPKFLILKTFEFDAEKSEIKIQGAFQNWQDYVRFYRYLTSLPDIEIKESQPPKLEKNLINFSMVLFLKPSFYKE